MDLIAVGHQGGCADCGFIGPRFGVARGYLAAIGKAGFHSGGRMAIKHSNGMAMPRKKIGGTGANNAGAKNDNVHKPTP
jgi:hypothetical protein